MLAEMWRVLAPGGLFFARLATSIGLERHLPSATGRMRLPDGSERYVVDEPTLLDWTSRLGGTLVDPIKTTNVQNMRCMTTWVMEKQEPLMSGLELATRLRAMNHSAGIVIVTMHEDAAVMRAARARGALGTCSKLVCTTDLPLALRRAVTGQPFVSPSLEVDEDGLA